MNSNEHSFREYEAIEQALKSYLDSTKTGESDGFAHDWFDHARAVGSVDGEAVNITRDELANFVSLATRRKIDPA